VAVSNVELRVDARNAVQALKKASDESKKLETAAKGVTSATTKVGREMKTAANGMQYFIDAAGRARKANGQFVTTAEAAAAGLKGQGTAAKAAAGNFDGLAKKAARLAAAYIGLNAAQNAAKFVFFKTAELETQARSLKVLTGSLGEAQRIIKELQAFGAVTPFTSSELIETAKRLKAFGFETEKIVDTTKRLGDIAGATGADLGGIATAFGQIQAKGRLQGEELLQLQERGVDLAGTLRKEYGLTGEEFQKALSKGQISAEAVSFALEKLTEKGGKYADGAISQSDTLAGKFSTLQDGIDNIARKIGEVLAPSLKSVLDLAIDAVNNINAAFAAGSITDTQKQGFKQLAEEEVKRFAGPLPGGPFGAGEIVVRTNGKTYKGAASSVVSQITNDLINAEIERLTQASAPKIPKSNIQTKIPALGAGTNGGAGSGGGRSGFGNQKVDISQKVLDLNLKLLAAQESEQKRLAATLALMVEKENILQSGLQPREEELRMAQAMSTFRQEIKGIDKEIADQRVKDIEKAAEGFEAQMAHQDELRQAIAEQKSAYEELNTTFRNGIVDSILDAVEGTRSLKDSLLGVIKSMARLILQQQLMNALGGFNLFGGGGGGAGGGFGVTPATSGLDFSGAFANGGRPAVGKAALVGERGPELFVPDRPGTIVPNHAMGSSNIVVNVDASGSNVQGDAQQGKALGQAIGAAVQAELIKQKRPGGLLS